MQSFFCNDGHYDYDDSVAHAFDDITTGKVYASDGNVSFYPTSSGAAEKLLEIGKTVRDKMPPVIRDIADKYGKKIANIVENTTGIKRIDIYPVDKYEPRLSTIFNQGEFENQLSKLDVLGREIPKIRLPKGFYYLDDGEVTYD